MAAIRLLHGVQDVSLGEKDNTFGARSQERYRLWKKVIEVFDPEATK